MSRRRLDAELVRRGLARTRAEAQAAVRHGLVRVDGRPAAKPSTLVSGAEPVTIAGPARRFVSRGGEKLDAALERFGLAVSGCDCLDAGASTGGFTDCLLQRGAARVIAVDVGYGQLAWRLRTDARVSVLERVNLRSLTPDDVPFPPQVVVADLSFISLRLVLPALVSVATPDARLVLLVKPQFEAGPSAVGSGGVVRDPEIWRRAILGVVDACRALGIVPTQVMASPLPGPAGNVEFLLGGERRPPAARDRSIDPAVDAAVSEGRTLGGLA